jgi:hypothetical protein
MKLNVVVGDVGQGPKVEDLAQSEGAGHDRELTMEADTTVWGGAACSSDEAGGSNHHKGRIALDAAPYLAYHLKQGQNHGMHSYSSRCQSMGLWWLEWTQEHKNHAEKMQWFILVWANSVPTSSS